MDSIDEGEDVPEAGPEHCTGLAEANDDDAAVFRRTTVSSQSMSVGQA